MPERAPPMPRTPRTTARCRSACAAAHGRGHYDGARFWCGPTSEDELDAIVHRCGRQGEIYGQLSSLRDRYGDLIRRRFPKIKRRVSGYNLDQLLPENGFNVARALVGSEGTCALTLQALARLVKSPPERVLLAAGFADICAAGDAVPEVLAAGPIACESLDTGIIGGLRKRGFRRRLPSIRFKAASDALEEFSFCPIVCVNIHTSRGERVRTVGQ